MFISSSSSFSNVSLVLPIHSSNSSLHHLYYKCIDSTVSVFIFIAFAVTNSIVLLPISILVLYLGYQRQRRQHSVSTVTTMSHSDIFTYHAVTIELIGFLGSVFSCCVVYMNLPIMIMVGVYALSIVFPGQILFHCLTCVERYLAVVYPIIYLGLRKAGGVRLRNIGIGCAWLLCFGWLGLTALYSPDFPTIPLLCLLTFVSFLISFCSLSVLYTLIRPGPGRVGGDRERVDQSKRRAFHTIMAIWGVLLFRFIGLLICVAIDARAILSYEDGCVLLFSGMWTSLPCSLVLPLLFLHRAGKLTCCRPNAESG